MRSSNSHQGGGREIPSGRKIALNFLPLEEQDFLFTVYRRKLATTAQSVPGTHRLPEDCTADDVRSAERLRYEIALEPRDGFTETPVRAWVSAGLAIQVLYQAIVARSQHDDLKGDCELPDNKFRREIAFLLKRHGGDVREIMVLRPFALRANGYIGFLCRFALRAPDECALSERARLELSLTHKNGKTNEDFYLDHREKIERFLSVFYDKIKTIRLHDASDVTLARRLSVIPSFLLERRVYIFGGGHEATSQFFGLRDHGPYQMPSRSTDLVFAFAKDDRERAQHLYRALRGESYPTFPGMEKLFHVKVGRDNVTGMPVEEFTSAGLQTLGRTLKDQHPSAIPIMVVPWSKHSSDEETDAYYTAKHALLTQHLWSQFVDRKRIDDRNSLKWSISNIGLGLFAKMGGVPWLVKPSTANCLIVGIGQAHRMVDDKIERYIAYSVLSDSTGLYEAIHVLGNTTDHKQYLDSLRANLWTVLTEHAGRFSSFVIHVTFSMRTEEINLIVEMLRDLENKEGNQHEFIAVKFNDRNDFFGFSVDHNSLVPFEGTIARLSNQEFLMWFSGLSVPDAKVPKKPEKPVHLQVLYPKHPLPEADLRRIFQDAINIAGTNWRGFNAKSMPISVYYAQMIAKFYQRFRELELPDVDFESVTPWFL
jgi:hypothetical protein